MSPGGKGEGVKAMKITIKGDPKLQWRRQRYSVLQL